MVNKCDAPKVVQFIQQVFQHRCISFGEGDQEQQDLVLREVDRVRWFSLAFTVGFGCCYANVYLKLCDKILDYMQLLVVHCEVQWVPHDSLDLFIFVHKITDQVIDTPDVNYFSHIHPLDFLLQSLQVTGDHTIDDLLVELKF